jgi:hypothetical protein
MNCLEYQDKMSAFCDGQLPDQEWLEMEGHLSKCSVCFEENSKLQNDLFALQKLDLNFDQLKVPSDFSQSVMARVRVSQVGEVSSNAIWKRAGVFVLVFVVYAIYVLSATDVNGHAKINSSDIIMNKEVMLFNLLIAGLGLVFIFFSNEMVGLNNKVLKRFSEQYEKVRNSDIFVSRLIGVAIFLGILTHKLVYSSLHKINHIFN